MIGEYSGAVPDSGVTEDYMTMLRALNREEIGEVLSEGFCQHCLSVLQNRIQSVTDRKLMRDISISNANSAGTSPEVSNADSSKSDISERSLESSIKSTSRGSIQTPESTYLERQKGYFDNQTSASVDGKRSPLTHLEADIMLNDRLGGFPSLADKGLSEEHKENSRFAHVGRKKDFVHMERINEKRTNVLQGLELHTGVFNAEEHKKIVECVYNLQRMGQEGQLRERTYTEPSKWMRGKGRVTIQFGCCYNYAVDKNGNPPGIIRDEDVDPLPPLFKQMIKRMVRWHVLPPTCIPNSCIVNIYEKGDCIPPHIDHHDFLRPFCTISFLTECNILFGANLKVAGPGEFSGPVSIPLPIGSVLILSGNGADVAKHCVPAVPAKRISITFRKMNESKIPYSFLPDPDLQQGMRPLVHTPLVKTQSHQNELQNKEATPRVVANMSNPSFLTEKDDFPPLGSLKSSLQKGKKNGLKL